MITLNFIVRAALVVVSIYLSREINVAFCLVKCHSFGDESEIITRQCRAGRWYMVAVGCLDHMKLPPQPYRQDSKEYYTW